jgi:hypothetical protein
VTYVYGMDHSAEPDEDGGHVVAAQTGHGVLGEQFVESLLHDGPIVLPLTNFLLNDIY